MKNLKILPHGGNTVHVMPIVSALGGLIFTVEIDRQSILPGFESGGHLLYFCLRTVIILIYAPKIDPYPLPLLLGTRKKEALERLATVEEMVIQEPRSLLYDEVFDRDSVTGLHAVIPAFR